MLNAVQSSSRENERQSVMPRKGFFPESHFKQSTSALALATSSGIQVYCDGGTLGPNPSKQGGVWAYVCVEDDEEIFRDSGLVTPSQAGLLFVSCNHVELLACIMALERLPDDWHGAIYTD